MGESRIDVFKTLAEQQPDDVMIWYGLGTEYSKLEQWTEAASALERVIELNPDYTAAYQMLGSALMGAGKNDDARAVWTKGIEAADRTGAWKARQHLEGLLAQSAPPATREFCD
jgi:uncharacterized protein HemY